jgi:glycine/D-amino acid oxidase-like deaminating enzyme
MLLHEFDITIIGGGCIGSSILYALTQRGFKNIALLDYGRQTLSATAMSGGMLRVFHEQVEHVELALENMTLLKKYQHANVLKEKTDTNGHLYFFNKSRYHYYKNNLFKMHKAHYPCELLTAHDGKNRFPQYCWNEEWAIYEPQGKQLSSLQWMQDLLIASKKEGISVFDNCEVKYLRGYYDRYQLVCNQMKVVTKILVLAGGARLLPRLSDLGLNLDFNIKKITTYTAKKWNKNFLLPNYFDRETLSFGGFTHQEDVIFSSRHCNRIKEKKWDITEKKSANDIYAPKRQGFLGKVTGFSGLYLATGWGGTAFKFSLAIGHHIANAIDMYSGKRGA